MHTLLHLKALAAGICLLIARVATAESIQFTKTENERLKSTKVAEYRKPFEAAVGKSSYRDELACLASSPLNVRHVSQNYFSAADSDVHYLTANAYYHVAVQDLSKAQCVHMAGTASRYPVFSIEVRDSKKVVDRLQLSEFTETDKSHFWSVSQYEEGSTWSDRPCTMRPDDATDKAALEAGRKLLHQHIIDKVKKNREDYDRLVANRATVPCVVDNCGQLPNPKTYIDALEVCSKVSNEAVKNAVAQQLSLFETSAAKKQDSSSGVKIKK